MKTGVGSFQGATSHRARAAGQLCSILSVAAALSAALSAAGGCQPEAPAPSLSAGTAAAAEGLVRDLLDASVTRAAPRGLCEAGAEGEARAVAAIGELQAYSVDHVEPAWVGSEPYFRVDVTLRRAAGEERRSAAVRAREGCVERIWGAPLPAAIRPEEGEVSL